MARIRTIKPDFFTSDDICALSPLARLLYIGLWCEADKEGRFQWTPRVFKRRYLPDDVCDIEVVCRELLGRDLVRLYGDDLAYIPTFRAHQHVNPRETESKLPAPDDQFQSEAVFKNWRDVRRQIAERDGEKCARCGATDNLDVDHILPRSSGGPHVIENVRFLCRKCNRGRPVAGKALDDDLARDGYTLASLRVKFGIDASIPDQHAQVGKEGREGKGKEGNALDASRRVSLASELPDDWSPSDDDLAWAGKNRPALTPAMLVEETERFRNHAKANARTAFNWGANWRNWISKAVTTPAAPSGGNGWKKPDPTALPPDEPWEQRMMGWRVKKFWMTHLWGPPPGEYGCRVPKNLQGDA